MVVLLKLRGRYYGGDLSYKEVDMGLITFNNDFDLEHDADSVFKGLDQKSLPVYRVFADDEYRIPSKQLENFPWFVMSKVMEYSNNYEFDDFSALQIEVPDLKGFSVWACGEVCLFWHNGLPYWINHDGTRSLCFEPIAGGAPTIELGEHEMVGYVLGPDHSKHRTILVQLKVKKLASSGL